MCEDWNSVIAFVSRTDRASLIFNRTIFNKLLPNETQQKKKKSLQDINQCKPVLLTIFIYLNFALKYGGSKSLVTSTIWHCQIPSSWEKWSQENSHNWINEWKPEDFEIYLFFLLV